jgi:hypothetical protein
MADKNILLIEIPSTVTAEEMEAQLNEPCERGYRFVKLLFLRSAVRAVYTRRVLRIRDDEEDERAREIVRQNPDASLRDLERILKKAGLPRGKDWCRTNRRK